MDVRRVPENRTFCKNCGYDLSSHVAGDTCPECGSIISPRLVPDRLSYRTADEVLFDLFKYNKEIALTLPAIGFVIGFAIAALLGFLF